MTTEALEIERKYDTDAGTAPPLDGLPGVSAVDGPRQHTLEASYFDTDDLRLARAGITLRRRIGGDDAGWHLKLPAGGVGERLELRLPLDGPEQAVPRELVELTLARTRGAALRQVAQLRTERTAWRLLDDDGAALAEVVSDDVVADAMDEPDTAASWHELEVELVGGHRQLLDAVEARLREFGARPSESASKLGRLLGDRLPDTDPPPRGGERSAGDTVLDYLRAQVENIISYDPRVRRDEPDAVHKMRVAARRARSTLQACRKVLDRECTAPVVTELRWLGTVLAGARDAEEQRGRLLSRLNALPGELVAGPVVSRVDGHFFHTYTRARESMLADLRGPRYLALLDALQELLDNPPLTTRAARPAAKVLPATVGTAQRRVRRAVKRYRADPDGPQRDGALHDARKAAKRARYAAEAAAPVIGKPARRTAKRLKAVQSLLGDHQDCTVSRGLLRELGMRAHLDGDNGFSYGLILGQDISEASQLRSQLPAIWKRAETGKARRWLR